MMRLDPSLQAALLAAVPGLRAFVKSRTNRARARLAELLSVESADDLGPDRTIHAALCADNLRWAA
jgi:hypothetical protein